MRLSLLIAVFCLATPAPANPILSGLTSTGLEFDQTEAVAIIEEDLRIDPDRISVDYLFRNQGEAELTGEVTFPLPPISSVDWLGFPRFPQGAPELEHLVDFKVQMNGREARADFDVVAVIEPTRSSASEFYDTPGRDVTADLQRLGLPVSVDDDVVEQAIRALSKQATAEAVRLGLLDPTPEVEEVGNPYPQRMWSLVIRHHWPQAFPVGEEVAVSISYLNLMDVMFLDAASMPPASVLMGPDLCADAATAAGMEAAMIADPRQIWALGLTSFVLRTAHSWAGPIGRFRLTVDKGEPDAFVMTCAMRLVETGPTTLLWESADFVPDGDLAILFVTRAKID